VLKKKRDTNESLVARNLEMPVGGSTGSLVSGTVAKVEGVEAPMASLNLVSKSQVSKKSNDLSGLTDLVIKATAESSIQRQSHSNIPSLVDSKHQRLKKEDAKCKVPEKNKDTPTRKLVMAKARGVRKR
jgi:hypothetical protein